jgi:hypothetical protein
MHTSPDQEWWRLYHTRIEKIEALKRGAQKMTSDELALVTRHSLNRL